jgi:hypothetical protein
LLLLLSHLFFMSSLCFLIFLFFLSHCFALAIPFINSSKFPFSTLKLSLSPLLFFYFPPSVSSNLLSLVQIYQ